MILVTGGCGYIGSHIVKKLSETHESVVVLDNLSHGRTEALLHGEPLVVGDITSRVELQNLFAHYPIDTVIHCAALVNAAESVAQADEYHRVNTVGTELLVETAGKAGVKHLIFASSAAVYGRVETTDPVNETMTLKPSNPYGESKVKGEQAVKGTSGSNHVILRFFNVAGAESSARLYQSPKNRAIMTRLFAACAGTAPEVTISGNNYATLDGTVVRDFIHVEDIAEAVVCSVNYLRKGNPSVTLNLGSATPTSMKQLTGIVERLTGKSIKVIYGPPLPGDIAYSLADIKQAETVLGWHPSFTIDQIVQDGWKAYCAHI